MTQNRTQILDHRQIEQKISRIAYQIYEANFEEKEIVVVGILKRGFAMAERVAKAVQEISDIPVQLVSIDMHHQSANGMPESRDFDSDLDGKAVVLVDDVLNSGKTMIYAVRHILDYRVKTLITVVLIDRRHRTFPIRADYVGLTLATTMQEHISVEFEAGNDAAYLQ